MSYSFPGVFLRLKRFPSRSPDSGKWVQHLWLAFSTGNPEKMISRKEAGSSSIIFQGGTVSYGVLQTSLEWHFLKLPWNRHFSSNAPPKIATILPACGSEKNPRAKLFFCCCCSVKIASNMNILVMVASQNRHDHETRKPRETIL